MLTISGATSDQEEEIRLLLGQRVWYDFGFVYNLNEPAPQDALRIVPDFGDEFASGFMAEWRVDIVLGRSESQLRDDRPFSRAKRPYGDVTYEDTGPWGVWTIQIVEGVSDLRLKDTLGYLLGMALLMERVRGPERRRVAGWFGEELSNDDAGVPSQVYSIGAAAGASQRHLLVAMMVGLVEAPTADGTSFYNPRSGTADSVGWRQERLSIYGPTAYSVQASATRFFQEVAAADSGQSLGDLAQAVQNSAFPERYALVEDEARALLARVQANVDWYAIEPQVAEAFKTVFWPADHRIGGSVPAGRQLDLCKWFNCKVPCMPRWRELYGQSSTAHQWLGPYESEGEGVRGGFLQTSKPSWMAVPGGEWRGLHVPEEVEWIDFEGDFRSNPSFDPAGAYSPSLSVGFAHVSHRFTSYIDNPQGGYDEEFYPHPLLDADFTHMALGDTVDEHDRPWMRTAIRRNPWDGDPQGVDDTGTGVQRRQNSYPDEIWHLGPYRTNAWHRIEAMFDALASGDLPPLYYLYNWKTFWRQTDVTDDWPFGLLRPSGGRPVAYPWQDPDIDTSWGVTAFERPYSPALVQPAEHPPLEVPLRDSLIRFTSEGEGPEFYTRGSVTQGPDYEVGAVWNNLRRHSTSGRGQFGYGHPQFTPPDFSVLGGGLLAGVFRYVGKFGLGNHSGSFEMELCNPPGWCHPLADRLWRATWPGVLLPPGQGRPEREPAHGQPVRQHSQWPLLWRVLKPAVNYWPEGLYNVDGYTILDPLYPFIASGDADTQEPMGRGYFPIGAAGVSGPFGHYFFNLNAAYYLPQIAARLDHLFDIFSFENLGSEIAASHGLKTRPWYRSEPQLKWRFSIRVNGRAPGYLAHYWTTSSSPSDDPDPIEDGPYAGSEAMEWRIRDCPCFPAGPPGGGPPTMSPVPGEVKARGVAGQARPKKHRPGFRTSVG